jgi:hypothetical protein
MYKKKERKIKENIHHWKLSSHSKIWGGKLISSEIEFSSS